MLLICSFVMLKLQICGSQFGLKKETSCAFAAVFTSSPA